MPCNPIIQIVCALGQAASTATNYAGSSILGDIASAIETALTWVLTEVVPLWLKIPSPDLTSEPAISAISGWLLPIAAAVAVGGMIAAAARMAITRKAAPLLDVSTGLVTIAMVSALGVVLPNLLLKAGDAWSGWVLSKSSGNLFASKMNQMLYLGLAPDVLIILLGILAICLLVVQAGLLIFRQASVVLLAALLPLAAAGSIAPLTRGWIRKLVSWMLALICYKPAAAAVYAAGLTMMRTGQNLQTTLMGFAMLIMSVLALPVLMRFFTWTTGAVASSGGGSGFLGMAAAGGVAFGALGNRPSSVRERAADQASDTSTRASITDSGSGRDHPLPPGAGSPSSASTAKAASGTGAAQAAGTGIGVMLAAQAAASAAQSARNAAASAMNEGDKQ